MFLSLPAKCFKRKFYSFYFQLYLYKRLYHQEILNLQHKILIYTLFSFKAIPLFNNCVKLFQQGIAPVIPLLHSQASSNLLFAKVVILNKNKL